MKFYSEITKKLYDTEKELVKAENEIKVKEIAAREAEIKKKAERKNRAKEVEEALKVANDAQNKAIQLLKDFTRDYGYFHISYTKDDVKSDKSDKADFFSIINDFISF